jgi:hypothetical protein
MVFFDNEMVLLYIFIWQTYTIDEYKKQYENVFFITKPRKWVSLKIKAFAVVYIVTILE